MKAPLAVVLLLSSVPFAFGDGVVVFLNSGITFRTPGDRRVFVFNQPVTGVNFVAQLYYGSSPSNLRSASEPPAHFRAATTTAALLGTWTIAAGQPRERVLTGFNPGETLWLQVRVWDSTLFSTFEAATSAGQGLDLLPFPYTIPLPEARPDAYYMENFKPSERWELPTFPRTVFPPVRVGNDIVITWRPRPDLALYQTIGTNPLAWQPVSPAPTNGIFQAPMTGEVVLFGLVNP